MVATRRRSMVVSPLDTKGGADATQTIGHQLTSKEDENSQLISSCVEILKPLYPLGMTTKELSGALDEARLKNPSLPVITSSVLSSKLNSFFRRFHSDAPQPSLAQLRNLPLTREASKDGPKRLVYKFARVVETGDRSPRAPSGDAKVSGTNEEEDVDGGSVSDSSVVFESESESVSPPPQLETEDVAGARSFPADTKREPEPSVKLSTPALTPADSASEFEKESSEMRACATSERIGLRRSEPATPPSHGEEPMRKKRATKNSVNLYYDMVEVQQMSPAVPLLSAPQSPRWGLDFSEDLDTPEALTFEELDTLVC